MVEKNGYQFRYFFNAGLDRRTLECDVEGVDVFEEGHYIGSINWVSEDDILDMTDDELDTQMAECGIFGNL
jgi:hypothetical protein